MQINHKSKEFALGLFSTDYDRYYIPEFVTCLGLRGAAYKLFRMIYFYTERRINNGYVTYARGEICKGLKVSRITVDRAFSTLQKKGLIICEMVQRDGKVYRGYRVDKDDIWRRIDEAKKQQDTSSTASGPPVSPQLGHLTALEHSVPFTPVRPLCYPTGEGLVDKDDIWRRIDEAKKQQDTSSTAARRSSECVTEGERGTRASAITTLTAARSPHGSGTLSSIHSRSAASLPEEEGLSHSPSVRTSLTPPSQREASKGGDGLWHE